MEEFECRDYYCGACPCLAKAVAEVERLRDFVKKLYLQRQLIPGKTMIEWREICNERQSLD